MRFEFDPESGALYIRIREGEIEEILELGEPGFGAYLDIDRDGNVMGAELLSLEEFTQLIARSGGVLKLPDHVRDPGEFHHNPA
jgi:uncharacterized protein YuzE